MSDNDVVIRVEGLGKKYSLHHEQPERYQSLRDVWMRQAKAAGRWLNPFTLAGQLRQARRHAGIEPGTSEEEFWALKDVSFEIRRGERVGIIGRNGAGKSTLLKILSRITEPTTGRVEIRGRVASLLEVGTGFHPELTGRENIYLNGAILGMTRREIRAKFDEIVDFAEVEKFLDTPVKRYSSGMYVRLAFAVAAYLEPEILLVDEVLAVGDAIFQKKCLQKMEDVSNQEQRTLLFVSHNIGAIRSLCNQGLLISKGKISHFGDIQKTCQIYEESSKQSDYRASAKSESAYVEHAYIRGEKNFSSSIFSQDENLKIHISIRSFESQKNLVLIGFIHSPSKGGRILMLKKKIVFSTYKDSLIADIEFAIPSYVLMPGFYEIELGVMDPPSEYLDHGLDRISFQVVPGQLADHEFSGRDLGVFHRSILERSAQSILLDKDY